MPTVVVIELDTPVQAVGKFLGFARALAPAFLPRLKTMLPELVQNHFPVLAPMLALEGKFDLGEFVMGLLKKRIGYLNLPEPILRASVECLESYAASTQPQQAA